LEEIPLYDKDGSRAGFSTSFMYSPMMQNHIAIAQVAPDFATLGSEVDYEVTIDHELHYIPAAITKMPFYDPPQKTG
jgi:aminomethyltransferase